MSASKFTPESRGGLLERTAAGVSLPDAARAVGIREATVKSWVARGRREGEGQYAEFALARGARAGAGAARDVGSDEPDPWG